MDSANSSSMQSSSGGDEEYDSRADQSLSAFLDHHHHHGGALPPPSPPPPPPHHHLHHPNDQQLHFNNPLLSNYFDNTFLTRNPPGPDPATPQPGFSATSSSLPLPPPPPPQPQGHNSNSIGVVKRSKKRSRASRRAPTTVLTTDTSNFRAMVQEFTGIPAPPLFSNNLIMNTRLNTFLGLSPSSSSSASYNNLLRPFPHKLLPTSTSPLLCSSDSVLRSSINNNQIHTSNPLSSSADVFQNLHLQSLLQVPVSHTNREILKTNVFTEEFGLGGLQSTDLPSTSTNRDCENGGYGDHNSDHRHHDHDHTPRLMMADENGDNGMDNPTGSRNQGTVESWLCSSSSDQRT